MHHGERQCASGNGWESMLRGNELPVPATCFPAGCDGRTASMFLSLSSGFVQEPLTDRLRGESFLGTITS
jgi:hypothetical protein